MAGRHGYVDVDAGARYLAGQSLLVRLLAGQLLAALSAGATSALLVVLVTAHLRAPPAGYGIALGAIGVGAAVGPLVVTKLVRRDIRAGWVFGPYALRAVVDLALASTASLPVAAVALIAYGLGTSMGAVAFTSLVQASTPDGVRGRVLATFDGAWQLGRLASLGVGGVLAETYGIPAVYLLGGCLLLVAAALGLPVRLPRRGGGGR